MSSTARFTVAKVDAGMAILLTPDHFLVEFPSLLLPASITPGCVVNISVLRDPAAERTRHFAFARLQDHIARTYGTTRPEALRVTVHAAHATAVTLAWEPLRVGHADVRAIEVWRDGGAARVKVIAGTRVEEEMPLWTRVGGLDVDREYTFTLRLRTSAGTLDSTPVVVRTLTLDHLHAIHVTFGLFESALERRDAVDKLRACLQRMGARWDERGEVTRDTTHVVAGIGRGAAVERARLWNIPVVRPEWVFACEAKKRLQPAGAFYVKGSGGRASTTASRTGSVAGVVASATHDDADAGATVRSIPDL